MLHIKQISDSVVWFNRNGVITQSHAVYWAQVSDGIVYIFQKPGTDQDFSEYVSNILVNDEHVTEMNVLEKLYFIGNFRGGGISAEDVGKALEDVLENAPPGELVTEEI